MKASKQEIEQKMKQKLKEELDKLDIEELKAIVEKDCWITVKQFYEGLGSLSEAQIAAIILGRIASDKQAKNNLKQQFSKYPKDF